MRAVTVHRGARDGYQVAKALQEAGLLDRLVTDLYWPGDRGWASGLEQIMPSKVLRTLRCRYASGLTSSAVESRWFSGIASLAVHKCGWLPFGWQSKAIRWCDLDLGRRAGLLASRHGAALLSYSYYGHSSFTRYKGPGPKLLFQLHPHPQSVRSILMNERELHPECASSLDAEWELGLPRAEFDRLVGEVAMADYWIVASSFTKKTLIEADIPSDRIEVIPYGIELGAFACKQHVPVNDRKLRLLFVGTLGQRKGIKYLLDAMRLLPPDKVELTMCGRPVDDLSLIRNSGVAVNLLPSISTAKLREEFRSADVFVFPSLAEGFGHVLLEAMASGLPIISTERTAAPDLIVDGREGFITASGSVSELTARITEFLREPERAAQMGKAARTRAEFFTWGRFRKRLSDVVTTALNGSPEGLAEPTCSLR